jgi:hypothetical protein
LTVIIHIYINQALKHRAIVKWIRIYILKYSHLNININKYIFDCNYTYIYKSGAQAPSHSEMEQLQSGLEYTHLDTHIRSSSGAGASSGIYFYLYMYICMYISLYVNMYMCIYIYVYI